jgi:hypothetical protein
MITQRCILASVLLDCVVLSTARDDIGFGTQNVGAGSSRVGHIATQNQSSIAPPLFCN